jgi:hypothetical protein
VAKSAPVLKRTLFAALQLSQFAKKSGGPRALLSGQLLIDCSKHKKMSVENIINCPFKTKKAEM